MDVDDERDYVIDTRPTKFWFTGRCSGVLCVTAPDEEKTNKEVDNEEEELTDTKTSSPAKMFDCPTPKCSASFIQFHNLQRHILQGRHKKNHSVKH